MSRTVLYAEVPGFYAQVERADDPSLRARPVIVGGDPRKRGLVQAATTEALAAGVSPGMPVVEALQRCPEARALRTNMRLYREASRRLRTCFACELDRVEPAGLDAAYLDATGIGASGPGAADGATEASRETPVEALARRLRARVHEELGLDLRVGIAAVRFLARLAAEASGEAGVRRIPPGEEGAFLRALPVDRLPGVGPRTEAQLRALGACTAGELAGLPRERLEEALGNHGLSLLAMARGQGDDRVRASWHPQSLSQEHTLADSQPDLTVLDERLRDLAQGLEEALGQQGLAARRLVLRVRYLDQNNATRSRTLPRGLRTAAQIHTVARELLARTHAGSRPVKRLGLSVTGVHPAPGDDRQLELFSPAE